STMKVPVMIALFRAYEAGALDLDAAVPVTATFRSVVDGAPFRMEPDEVDAGLAALEGTTLPVRELIERMITDSSNEATDILLECIDLPAVQAVVQDLGASRTVIARPIGDLRAAAAGIQNLVTADDLVRIMTAIVTGKAARAESCVQMAEILCRQRHRVGIPDALPPEVTTASKGGWVTRLRHDVAVVWPPDAPPYCQAICTRGLEDGPALAEIHQRATSAYADRHTPS
ncbi:MAG TPA: serine hydrolase, partial [Mycobacteriales bacterium]|nr:serine hydrolase [Mycobacteriales bacterium]